MWLGYNSATTFKVVPPGTNTLSSAVAGMSDGDVLMLGRGTYTQTESIVIPTTVTNFSIIGPGPGAMKYSGGAYTYSGAIIKFTADCAGIYSQTGDNSYRITHCVLQGFTMVMTATSSTRTAIYLWGDCPHREITTAAQTGNGWDKRDSSIVIRNVVIRNQTATAYWNKGIEIVNAWCPFIEDCVFFGPDATSADAAISLLSCVTGSLRGGYFWGSYYGIDLDKADDGLIFISANKHGCEGLQLTGFTTLATQTAIHLGTKSLSIMISDFLCDFTQVNGIAEEANSAGCGIHQISNGWIAQDPTHTNFGSGILLHNGSCSIKGCHIIGYADREFHGITLDSVGGSASMYKCTITGNIFENVANGVYIRGDASYGSMYNTVIGNTMSNIYSGYYAILVEHANCHGNVIVGNVLNKNGTASAISDSGTGTVVDHNYEY